MRSVSLKLKEYFQKNVSDVFRNSPTQDSLAQTLDLDDEFSRISRFFQIFANFEKL